MSLFSLIVWFEDTIEFKAVRAIETVFGLCISTPDIAVFLLGFFYIYIY